MRRKLSLKVKLMIKPSNSCSKYYSWSLALGCGVAEMSYFHIASRLTLRERVWSSEKLKELRVGFSPPSFFPEDTVKVVQASD